MIQTTCRRLGRLLVPTLLFLLGGLAVRAEAVPPQDQKPVGKEEKAPAVLTAKPLKIEAHDDELHKLLKERYNAAVAELQARSEEVKSGHGSIEQLFDAARKVLRSELSLSDKPADRLAVLEKHLELEHAAEKVATTRHQAGKLNDAELAAARYLRIDAEIQLLRAKQKGKPAAGK
jgi:hypothetical protein